MPLKRLFQDFPETKLVFVSKSLISIQKTTPSIVFWLFSETNMLLRASFSVVSENLYINIPFRSLMHPTEQRILQRFGKDPAREFSTNDLVRQVFPEEYEEARKYIYNEQNDKSVTLLGKRKKARLHRKILYYLSRLEQEGLIRVARTEGKGEKYFVLNADKEIVSKRDKALRSVLSTINIQETNNVSLHGLESYEEAKMVKRYDSQNWINRINSLIIESTIRNDISSLYQLVNELYPSYNDVLGLNRFEEVIASGDLQDLRAFIKKCDIDTRDYNKYINLLIDLSNVKDAVKLSDFIESFASINPEKMFVVFKANSRTISNHTRFIKQLIKHFAANKIRINIQNKDLKEAPYMIGRAGAYTFNDDEWVSYEDEFKGRTIGLCCSETSLYIDVHRFFREKKSFSEFRSFILKAAKALLTASTAQRKKSDVFFKTLNDLNKGYQNRFFAYSHNYIRLWNFDLSQFPGLDKEEHKNFEALIKSCAEDINEFCKSEETIFKSCGIPIRFEVVLSSAFRRFDPEFLSPRKYKKVTVKGIHDFQEPELLEYLRRREELISVFRQNDRVRFFRAPNFSYEEVISEFNFLLNGFNIPLFSYDFKPRIGELTLDSFIDE